MNEISAAPVIGHTIPVAALCDALTFAARVVEKRNSLPVLGAALLTVKDDLQVITTDLDIRVTVSIPGHVGDLQATLLSPKLLATVLANSGAESVIVAPGTDGAVSLTTSAFGITLESMDARDFPADTITGLEKFSARAPAAALRALARIYPAICREETRYYLNGIFLHAGGPMDTGWPFTAIATDGHRMHLARFDLEDVVGSLDHTIIPRKAIEVLLGKGLLRKPLEADAWACRLSTSGTKGGYVGFSWSDLAGTEKRITAKLIDGTYPGYQKVIDKVTVASPITLDRVALLRAVSLMMPTKEEALVRLDFEGGEVRLTRKAPGSGVRASTTLKYTGETATPKIEVGFNGFYLSDILNAFDTEGIVISFGDTAPSDPAVFSAPSTVDDTVRAVLMPMRLSF